jgi:hypothetical protein
MQFTIYNRWTDEAQFTAEIDCAEDAPYSVKVGLAVRWGVENGADLSGAVLSRAVLTDAVLTDAVLTDANGVAHKIKRLIASVERLSDEYRAHVLETQSGEIVGKWGCRTMTLADFAARAEAYGDLDKRAETLNIIAFVRAEAERLGVGKAQGA